MYPDRRGPKCGGIWKEFDVSSVVRYREGSSCHHIRDREGSI